MLQAYLTINYYSYDILTYPFFINIGGPPPDIDVVKEESDALKEAINEVAKLYPNLEENQDKPDNFDNKQTFSEKFESKADQSNNNESNYGGSNSPDDQVNQEGQEYQSAQTQPPDNGMPVLENIQNGEQRENDYNNNVAV